MTTTATDVSIRSYTDDDLGATLRLLEASLAGGPTGDRSATFFRWKHVDNPFGRSVGLVAEVDGRIVGLRTFMRWRFVANGQEVRAVRAVDTATHPDFQGRGIFTQLTLAALEEVRRDDHLVFNTPNDLSLPGYLKMGWQVVGTMPIAVRPVRVWRFLRGVRGVERGRPSGTVPACPLPPVEGILRSGRDVESLLCASAPDPQRLTTARSLSYLRWRYADVPELDYRVIDLWQGNELVGLAIGRPRKRGDLDEFTLTEVLVRDGDRTTVRRLLRAATRAGCDHVTAHLTPGGLLARTGPWLGYLKVPGQGLTLVANPVRDVVPDPMSPASWELSLGDLELF